MSLRDLDPPQNLDEAEHGDASDDLGDGAHDGLLLGHGPLHTRLEVVVGAGRRVTWSPG